MQPPELRELIVETALFEVPLNLESPVDVHRLMKRLCSNLQKCLVTSLELSGEDATRSSLEFKKPQRAPSLEKVHEMNDSDSDQNDSTEDSFDTLSALEAIQAEFANE